MTINEALIMETLDFLLEESLYVQNEERRDALQEDIKLRIPLTVKLSNTHIDFKSQDVQSQISGQEAVIEQLKLALTTAIKTGNLSQEKILNTTIAGAEKFLITLRKKQV